LNACDPSLYFSQLLHLQEDPLVHWPVDGRGERDGLGRYVD
jgi:hypothetical protein